MRLNLSYSSLELLHKCARKYELTKLHIGEGMDDMSIDLVAGKSFDAGLGRYWETGSFEEAVYAAYLAWTFPNGLERTSVRISETKEKKGNTIKAFYLVVAHLEKYAMTQPLESEGWKLWTLPSGKPATQVSFRVVLPNNKFYRGHIDGIHVNEFSGDFAAVEVKTSGWENAPRALWQNSFQGISYSFIVDYITRKNNPQQFFFVAEFPKLGQQLLDFYRSPQDKVSWIPSLAFDIQDIERYVKHNHFPMRASACYEFYRDCEFLGVCNLSRPTDYTEHKEEDPKHYDFNLTLEELLTARQEMYQ